MKRGGYTGFTLIELAIIIMVLGVLAAIAVTRYKHIASDAREAACRNALSALRSGITLWYANAAVKNGLAVWPPIDSVRTIDIVMAQSFPENPFCPESNAPDSIVAGGSKGTVIGTRGGWAYNQSTGEIWPNTSVAGENSW